MILLTYVPTNCNLIQEIVILGQRTHDKLSMGSREYLFEEKMG